MKTTAIIPARYASTRFEGKPLVDILGKPMIQRVYEGVRQSRLVDDVMVATDDERILKAVENFGGRAIMTSPDHMTGSDRVAEVARKLARRYRLSQRQAWRYVEQARDQGAVEVPRPKVVFTVKLPTDLVRHVRRQAKQSEQTISAFVAQALKEFLDRLGARSRVSDRGAASWTRRCPLGMLDPGGSGHAAARANTDFSSQFR